MDTTKSTSPERETISLSDEEGVKDVLTQSILGIWEVVNNLTRLRPSRHERYLVTIFGSARVPRDSWVYAAVREVTCELTLMNCDIATGGGPD
jgi:hypothetical protein